MSERLAEIEARVEAATARASQAALINADMLLREHARSDIPWLLEQVRETRRRLHRAAQEAAGGNLATYERLVEGQALADSGEAG